MNINLYITHIDDLVLCACVSKELGLWSESNRVVAVCVYDSLGSLTARRHVRDTLLHLCSSLHVVQQQIKTSHNPHFSSLFWHFLVLHLYFNIYLPFEPLLYSVYSSYTSGNLGYVFSPCANYSYFIITFTSSITLFCVIIFINSLFVVKTLIINVWVKLLVNCIHVKY